MADKKISQLSSLNQSSFAANDSIPIVDQSDAETKRTTIGDLDQRWAASTHTHVIGDTSGLQSALNSKEDSVASGTISQYYRGDKTFQTLDKTAIGLPNVDNTSDVNKPISNAVASALSAKANAIHSHTASDITDFATTVAQLRAMPKYINVYDDFTSHLTSGKLGWSVTSSGSGAAVASNNAVSETDVIGNNQISTGTTSTGRSSIWLTTNGYWFSNMSHAVEWKIKPTTLSTPGIQDYFLLVGFGNTTTAGDHVNGMYFKYDANISVNWLAVTARNSVRETSDTGIAVGAADYIRLRIEYTANVTEAKFYINDTLVATNTLNIPENNTVACGPMLKVQKVAGTTAQVVQFDRCDISSVRP